LLIKAVNQEITLILYRLYINGGTYLSALGAAWKFAKTSSLIHLCVKPLEVDLCGFKQNRPKPVRILIKLPVLKLFHPLGRAMIGLQYSIHRPSAFIHRHRVDLLPDWQVSVSSLMVILQTCPISLYEATPATEYQKRRLRRRSLCLIKTLIASLQAAGYAAEGFDPQTGQPFYSQPGLLTLDDVAVVQAVLGYPLVASGDCHLIKHPVWGCFVFPTVMVSEASPARLAEIAHPVLGGLERQKALFVKQ
jgi:hypothetical protein